MAKANSNFSGQKLPTGPKATLGWEKWWRHWLALASWNDVLNESSPTCKMTARIRISAVLKNYIESTQPRPSLSLPLRTEQVSLFTLKPLTTQNIHPFPSFSHFADPTTTSRVRYGLADPGVSSEGGLIFTLVNRTDISQVSFTGQKQDLKYGSNDVSPICPSHHTNQCEVVKIHIKSRKLFLGVYYLTWLCFRGCFSRGYRFFPYKHMKLSSCAVCPPCNLYHVLTGAGDYWQLLSTPAEHLSSEIFRNSSYHHQLTSRYTGQTL